MVLLWAGIIFAFLLTVPRQEKPIEKVWRNLEASVDTPKVEKKVTIHKRLKLGDIK